MRTPAWRTIPLLRVPNAGCASLEELAEIGMELVRALRPGADGVAEGAEVCGSPKRRDPVEQYASLSRSLRLTFALEAKTDEALAPA